MCCIHPLNPPPRTDFQRSDSAADPPEAGLSNGSDSRTGHGNAAVILASNFSWFATFFPYAD